MVQSLKQFQKFSPRARLPDTWNPLSNKHDLLEEQKDIIDKSRTEADHIVEQAKAEGDRLVDLAKAEAERLVRQEEVVKAAEEKANSIIETTQQYDRDMRAAADAYADKLHKESMFALTVVTMMAKK